MPSVDRGFSLIETAVAVVICGTLLASVVPITVAVPLMVQRESNMDRALEVGVSAMEQTVGASSSLGRLDSQQTVEGMVYHVETTLEPREGFSDASVRVVWSFRGKEFTIRLETIRS